MSASPFEPTVLVVGHICLDFIPALSAAPSLRPGHLQMIGPLELGVGGCVANTGGDLAALGIRTAVGGDLGDDALADLLRDRLADRGLDVSGFRTAGGTTSYSVVVQPPGADRTFWHHVGANGAFDGSSVAFGDADLLHVGYPPLLPAIATDGGAPLAALLSRAHAAGMTTSLDLAVVDEPDDASRERWTRILDRVLPLTDVISPSLDDLDSALGADAASPGADADGAADRLERALRAARALVAKGAAIAMVSAGAAGFALATGSTARFAQAGRVVSALGPDWHETEAVQPARVTVVARTTGAGDAVSAGLLAAVVRGSQPAEALAFAADVAAAKVSGRDLASVLV